MCTCGNPFHLGVVHRYMKPCYVAEPNTVTISREEYERLNNLVSKYEAAIDAHEKDTRAANAENCMVITSIDKKLWQTRGKV
jgi:hypothetical protein